MQMISENTPRTHKATSDAAQQYLSMILQALPSLDSTCALTQDCQTVKVRTFPICIFSKLRCLQVCCELDIVQKPVLMSINASSIHGAKLRSRR